MQLGIENNDALDKVGCAQMTVLFVNYCLVAVKTGDKIV